MDLEILTQLINDNVVFFEDLAKADPALLAAWAHMRDKAKEGSIDAGHLDTLRQHFYKDRKTGGIVGNTAAFEDFLESPAAKSGVHIFMDGNDFGSINNQHGHLVGDQAIRHMAGAVREAADESIGRDKVAVHRPGGDEFHVHAPTHEHAAAFLRNVRNKLDAIAPIGGTHKLKMSFGVGPTVEHSTQALMHAKDARKKLNYPVGQSEHHIHSLMPGREGAVPLDETPAQLPLAVR